MTRQLPGVDSDSHELEREREMDREGIVDEVGELLRDRHLFLILLGLGSLPQPPEPATQWGPAFFPLSRHLRHPMAIFAFTCILTFGRQVERWHGSVHRRRNSVRALEWFVPKLPAAGC